MQRRVLAVLEAHEAANKHHTGTRDRQRLMHITEIAAVIFDHRLTPSESSSLRRALNKFAMSK